MLNFFGCFECLCITFRCTFGRSRNVVGVLLNLVATTYIEVSLVNQSIKPFSIRVLLGLCDERLGYGHSMKYQLRTISAKSISDLPDL